MKFLRLPYKTVKLPTSSAMLPLLSREFSRLYQLNRFSGSQGNGYCSYATLASVNIKRLRLNSSDNKDEFYVCIIVSTRVVLFVVTCLLSNLDLGVCVCVSVCGFQCVQAVEKLCPQSAEDPAATDLRVSQRAIENRAPCPLQHTGGRCAGIHHSYAEVTCMFTYA